MELGVLKKYIDDNLEKGFIRPSTSSCASPVLFVSKKDKMLKLCIDFRQLNNITVKDRYALPLIKELHDRLHGARVFTSLDLRGTYNLIRMKEDKEWKTAFRTRYRLYEYTVIPFKLTNTPTSCQRMINEQLHEYLDIFVIAYLDDILIYSETLEEHVQHVKKVLDKLRTAGLLLKPEKYNFHKDEITFLGYIVEKDNIRMDLNKVKTILK
jgi:hypothetical protein